VAICGAVLVTMVVGGHTDVLGSGGAEAGPRDGEVEGCPEGEGAAAPHAGQQGGGGDRAGRGDDLGGCGSAGVGEY